MKNITKQLVILFRVVMVTAIALIALKAMFGNPIKEPTLFMQEKKITNANCESGKWVYPFIKIDDIDIEFRIIKEFTFRTGCTDGKEKTALYGKRATFEYFVNSEGIAKIVEISLNDEQIYTKQEFIGKSRSNGALIFISLIFFLVWMFFKSNKK